MHPTRSRNIDDLFRYKEAKLKELLNVHNSRIKESKEDDLMIQEIFGGLEIPSLPSPRKSTESLHGLKSSKNTTVRLELQHSEREIYLQQLLEQTSLDMNASLQEKQQLIDTLTEQLKATSAALQQTKDQYLSLKHFTSQFASNVKLLALKDNINKEEKSYITQSIAELNSFLNDKQAQANFITQKRRASLNAVPFDHRAAAASVEVESLSECDQTKDLSSQQNLLQPAAFMHLSDSVEDQVDFLFHRVVYLSHANAEGSTVHVAADDAYLTRKMFLNMTLALDLIDDKLTFVAVGSAFDRAAQQAERGMRKYNNRLLLNDFVYCLSICADFKYIYIDEQSRLPKLINCCLQSTLLQNDLVYIHLGTIFNWISDAQIFSLLSSHHTTLYKAYKRAKSYGSDTLVTSGNSSKSRSRVSSRNDGYTDSCGFLVFAGQFKIFPVLTKQSVVRRIAQYVRSRLDDDVGCFYASLIYLALTLSNNEIENISTEEKLAAMLKRILSHINGEFVRLAAADMESATHIQKKVAAGVVSGSFAPDVK